MHDLFQAGGFGSPFRAEVLVDVLFVTHTRSRIAHQLPPDQSDVPAVHHVITVTIRTKTANPFEIEERAVGQMVDRREHLSPPNDPP